MAEVEITYVQGNALYHRYPRQNRRQGAFVSLRCKTGFLTADYDAETGSVPFAVWHRRVLRWTIPALREDAANALLDEIAPLAQRVCDGYSERHNGQDVVGECDEDAEAACEEIRALCEQAGGEGAEVVVFDAADYLAVEGSAAAQCRAIGLWRTTTDAQLDEIRDQVEENADGVDIIEGLEQYLERLRENAPIPAERHCKCGEVLPETIPAVDDHAAWRELLATHSPCGWCDSRGQITTGDVRRDSLVHALDMATDEEWDDCARVLADYDREHGAMAWEPKAVSQ